MKLLNDKICVDSLSSYAGIQNSVLLSIYFHPYFDKIGIF